MEILLVFGFWENVGWVEMEKHMGFDDSGSRADFGGRKDFFV